MPLSATGPMVRDFPRNTNTHGRLHARSRTHTCTHTHCLSVCLSVCLCLSPPSLPHRHSLTPTLSSTHTQASRASDRQARNTSKCHGQVPRRRAVLSTFTHAHDNEQGPNRPTLLRLRRPLCCVLPTIKQQKARPKGRPQSRGPSSVAWIVCKEGLRWHHRGLATFNVCAALRGVFGSIRSVDSCWVPSRCQTRSTACLAGCMLPTPGSAAQTFEGSIPKSIYPRYHWSCAASPPTRAYLSLLLAVCTAAVAFRVHDMEWRVRVDAEAL